MIFFIKIVIALYPFMKEIYFKDKSMLTALRENKLRVALLIITLFIFSLSILLGVKLSEVSSKLHTLENDTIGYKEYKTKINDLNHQVRDYIFENNQLRLKNCSDFGDVTNEETKNKNETKEKNKTKTKQKTVSKSKQKDITIRDSVNHAFDYSP